MHKIWDGYSLKLKVIGRCGRDEKTNDYAEPPKANAKNKENHF